MKGIRWRFMDERHSSEEARERGRSAALDRVAVDDLAAMIILESYIAQTGGDTPSAAENAPVPRD
jgi:RNase H-fold protein (predicted Holliday junction resolvase)